MPPETTLRLTILLPVYDDWESARMMVRQLDAVLAGQPVEVRLVFVDDCSPTPAPADLAGGALRSIVSITSLRLRRNLGHQRAIAIGLTFIHVERPDDAVVVMDADGEDKPEDVPRLIRKFVEEGGRTVVFAARRRRSESRFFRLCYLLYRVGHRLLTGIAVRVGNFSLVPAADVATLVVVSETWNHYAASVFKSGIAHVELPAERGERLAGRSKMSFVALVLHGLSAISVFAETVGLRLALAISTTVVALLAVLAVMAGLRWRTDLALPGWATTTAGLLLMIVLQMLTVAVGVTLLVLFNRNDPSFLPLRDYHFFIAERRTIHERST